MKRNSKNKLFKPTPIPDRSDMNQELNDEWNQINELIWQTVGCVAEKVMLPENNNNGDGNSGGRSEVSLNNASQHNGNLSVADLSYIWRDEPNSLSAVMSLTPSSVSAEESSSLDSRRIYVSNIPFRYASADLHRLCQKIGPVVSAEVIYNERGSKGFGFVSFGDELSAKLAIKSMNGLCIDGRRIEVHPATPKEKSAAKGKKKADEGSDWKTSYLLLQKLQSIKFEDI